MENLKFVPIYKGRFGYTPNLYEREQKAMKYIQLCNRKIYLDFSELGGYTLASVLLCALVATIIFL